MNSYKKTIKNLIIFILLIIITFALIFQNQDFGKILNIAFSVNKIYVLLGIIAMTCYFILEGANIKNILNALGENTTLTKAFKYSLIGFFFSGITPAATGGQPMEIYTMHKDGIKVAYGTMALLLELCSFQMITCICGIIGAIINYKLLVPDLLLLFIIGLFLNLIALTTMLVCLFSKTLTRKIVNIFIKLLNLFRYKKIDEKKKSIDESVEKYNESADFIKNNKRIFFTSILFVLGQVIIYYSIPFFVYKSFGLNNYNLFEIMSIQALLFSSVSSIPLPGSVGISESVFLRIYNSLFGTELVSSAMLLNRGINFYLFIIMGFFIILHNIIRKPRNEK